MPTTLPTSSPAPTDRRSGPIPVALIGDAPLARALSEALTRGGVPAHVYQRDDNPEKFDGAGLVIEASDGSLPERAEALHAIEHEIPAKVPIGVLLSTETLWSLARGLHRPERLIGLSTLDTGTLPGFVEIVRTGASAGAALAVARAVFEMAGIRTITVTESQGRYTARVTRRYVNEGLALLGEGVPALAIEQAAQEAGMSQGPLALLDALSLYEADRLLHASAESQGHEHGGHGHDHGHDHDHDHDHGHGHGHRVDDDHGHDDDRHHRDDSGASASGGHDGGARASDAPDSAGPDPFPAPRPHGMTTEAIYVLEKMAHGLNRMGKHAGRGFYEYDEDDDEAPRLWPGLKAFERRRVVISPEDLRDRLLYVQSLESLRCLQDGGVGSPADADLASVLGWGFPDATGGAVAFVERTGPGAFLRRADELAQRYGERFDPPEILMERARNNAPFGSSPK